MAMETMEYATYVLVLHLNNPAFVLFFFFLSVFILVLAALGLAALLFFSSTFVQDSKSMPSFDLYSLHT